MYRVSIVALLSGLIVLSAGGLTGQEPKKDTPSAAKKEEPTKVKGFLPPNYKKVGLSEDQVQNIYKIQGKYNDDIDKLTAKIKDLKDARDKEIRAVLTPDQKKKLDDILTGKDK